MYFDADILIIGLVSDDGILNDGTRLKDAPFKDEIFTLDEIAEIKKYYRIKKIAICAVAIHIKNEKLHNKPLSAQRVIVACYMSEKPLRRLDIFIIHLVFLHVLCYYVG